MLSQLAWMDEEYIAKDPAVNGLSAKGKDFTEEDKTLLREKQHELLAAVLPEYRLAAGRGQIEISHDAVLPPDSSASVRHRYCARLKSTFAIAAASVSAQRGRT